MRLANRENNQTVAGNKIQNILGLENSQLILMERGDKLKKSIKKADPVFGDKNLYSVKRIKEALSTATKKKNIQGNYCCVCVENWTTNANGICNECDIRI